jgi:hypothetical protein
VSAARHALTLLLALAAVAALVSWFAQGSPPPATRTGQPWLDGSIVRGRVLLGGRELAGADVDARQEGGAGVRGLRAWEPIVTDTQGRFERTFDADATVELHARYGLSESRWVPVHTAPGSQDDVVLELVQPYVLRGRVLEPDGSPADDAQVYAITVTPDGRLVERDIFGVPVTLRATEADGAFAMSLTSPGRYRAVAEGPGGLGAEGGNVTLNDATREASVTLQLAPHPK